jgi:succinoglycan biosynthesis transport protein ExoP
MTFNQFLRIIGARWILALATFLVIVLGTLGVSLLIPKSYRAEVKVMADSRPDPVVGAGIAAMSGSLSSTYMETQVDIIKSDTVAQRVVSTLKLTDNEAMRQRWTEATGGKGNFTVWLADLIGQGLDVKPSRESNVFEIQYDSGTPAFAATLANAFAQAYIDTTVRIKTDPANKYAAFFEERAAMAREKLERARLKLAEVQKEKGIVISEERLDVELSRLAELGSQVTGLRSMKSEASNRASQSAKNADQMKDVLNNSVVASLKADLARTEARLQELSERYGDEYPIVRETKANVAALRDRIRSETRRVSDSARVDNIMVDSRTSEAERQFEEQRQRVLKMKDARGELHVLENEVDSAQRVYDAVQERLSQSSMEGKASQSGIYILSQATEPTHPASPRVTLNTIVAIFAGALIAVLFAMIAELLDRRVRVPLDIVHALEIPVIGRLPGPAASKYKSKFLSLGASKRAYTPVASISASQ